MLVVTRKEYEVETKIAGLGENKEVLYEFDMKLTDMEVKTLQDKIRDVMVAIEKGADIDLSQKLDNEIKELIDTICFKEHLVPFKEAMGELKYEEMVETIFNFFAIAQAEKRIVKANTMSSNLRKSLGN